MRMKLTKDTTDAQIDAWVDLHYPPQGDETNLREPGAQVYHIGIAPFNKYVAYPAYRVYIKELLKNSRDVQFQYVNNETTDNT